MATITAPLLSLGARGTIAKSITYSSWKGVSYARNRVIPANPNSTAQQAQRGVFQWVHDAYKYLPGVVTESWVLYAKGQAMTPANAWMQANNAPLKGKSDLADIVFSKPVNSGLPIAAMTATAGTTQITIAGTAPTLPAGWSITEMIGIAMKNVTPFGEMEEVISAGGVDTTSPYSLVISGLTTGQAYQCGAWFKFVKPNGETAYGAALNATATPT